MNELERSNYLAHYGVVGMKWGVRRTPEQLGRAEAKKSSKRPFISITVNKGAKKTESRKEVKAKAKNKLHDWFGTYEKVKLVTIDNKIDKQE